MTYSTPVLSGSIPNPATQPLQGVLTWTESDAPAGDDGSLLLHFDTFTPFIDTSGNGNVISNHGSPTRDTGNPKFGGGDAALAQNLNYLSTPVVAAGPLDFGSGDFTVEFWLLIPSLGPDAPSVDPVTPVGDTSASWVVVGAEQALSAFVLEFVATVGGVQTGCSSPATAITLNTWHSFAFVRQGTNFFAFADGVASVPVPVGSGTVAAPTTLYVGHDTGAGGFNQAFNIDELRITKGTALYTADYTPATSAFPDGGGSTPASGYDIYRDGVSIATTGQVLTYTDNVPTAGTYAYNVAAYVGGVDVSPQSNEVDLTYIQATIGFPNCIFDEAIFGGYFGGQLNLVEFTYMPGRTPFEEGATNLIINRYKQEPTDVRQRGVDFTQFVVPGELLQTVAVTGINAQGVPQAQTDPVVTPLVVTNVIIDPVTQLKFGFTVSGGQNGIEYTVQFTTTTNIQTQTLEEIFSINFLVEDMFP